MIIQLNGKMCDIEDGTTLARLITVPRGSAAVVDGEVVPRGQWTSYRIAAGQVVELVTAVQGG